MHRHRRPEHVAAARSETQLDQPADAGTLGGGDCVAVGEVGEHDRARRQCADRARAIVAHREQRGEQRRRIGRAARERVVRRVGDRDHPRRGGERARDRLARREQRRLEFVGAQREGGGEPLRGSSRVLGTGVAPGHHRGAGVGRVGVGESAEQRQFAQALAFRRACHALQRAHRIDFGAHVEARKNSPELHDRAGRPSSGRDDVVQRAQRACCGLSHVEVRVGTVRRGEVEQPRDLGVQVRVQVEARDDRRVGQQRAHRAQQRQFRGIVVFGDRRAVQRQVDRVGAQRAEPVEQFGGERGEHRSPYRTAGRGRGAAQRVHLPVRVGRGEIDDRSEFGFGIARRGERLFAAAPFAQREVLCVGEARREAVAFEPQARDCQAGRHRDGACPVGSARRRVRDGDLIDRTSRARPRRSVARPRRRSPGRARRRTVAGSSRRACRPGRTRSPESSRPGGARSSSD